MFILTVLYLKQFLHNSKLQCFAGFSATITYIISSNFVLCIYEMSNGCVDNMNMKYTI